VFVPIALAATFAAVLRPVIRRMEGWRIPAPLAALALMIGMLAVVVAGGFALSGPASEWLAKAPKAAASAGKKLRTLRHKFDWVGNAIQPPVRPAQPVVPVNPNVGNADSQTAPAPTVVTVAPAQPPPDFGPILSSAFGTTTEIISTLVTMLLLLFFLLAGGRTWRKRLLKVAANPESGQRMVDIMHETQQVISRYLFTMLLINICQGAVVGLAMWAVGMPSPLVWGIMCTLFEFIPYVGGLFMVLLLTLVGLSLSDNVGHAFIAPGLYLGITTVQNSIFSPMIYGRGLRLNPVPILIAVVAGWFMWGVPGAFLAVPTLGALSVICRRVDRLNGVGAFLAD
jgi:predicted PurR-regulated permease PerM